MFCLKTQQVTCRLILHIIPLKLNVKHESLEYQFAWLHEWIEPNATEYKTDYETNKNVGIMHQTALFLLQSS